MGEWLFREKVKKMPCTIWEKNVCYYYVYFPIMISVSESLPITDLSYANKAFIITLIRLNWADNHNSWVLLHFYLVEKDSM